MSSTTTISVGCFPYAPGFNPYQRLITESIESAGAIVSRIPPAKWFPLHCAIAAETDILHLDWPHDWYNGKNAVIRFLKTCMYLQGLRGLRTKPVIWTAHNLIAHDSPNPKREHRMIQKLINQCQGLMVLSEASRKLLLAEYQIPKDVSIKKIYHGHYIDCYTNQITRKDARKKLGIASSEFVYLLPGTIKPYKGHVEAIDAFRSFSTESDTLLIAGGGDYRFIDELRTLAEKNTSTIRGKVKFLPGFIADEEFQNFYNAADITVLPFRQVLNSGSLLLAMSFGSPVIAPKMGSIPEIAMAEYFFGYSPSSNSESTTANLATAMIHSKHKLTQTVNTQLQKKQIIEFTKDKYDWKKAGVLLRDWYIKLLDKDA